MQYKPYTSAVDKARQYLNSMQITPQDQSFIDQSMQEGYDENMYLPAIASKKMREQDSELQSRYESYRASPTTFMSNFKSEYGESGRGGIGDTVGFIKNLFVDLGENVEELSSAVIHLPTTLKGIGGALSDLPGTGKAIIGALKENFGSLEKAKETFYENPFDVLSVVIPVAKVGKVGTLAKMAGKATKLDAAMDAAKGVKALGIGKGVTKGAGLAEGIINQLADITNWDINIASAIAKKSMKIGGAGRDVVSSLIYGTKGKNTLKNLGEATKDSSRIKGMEEIRGMSEPQVIGKVRGAIDKTEEMAGKDLDNAVKQSMELGTHEIPTGAIKKDGTLGMAGSKDPLYSTSGSLDTDFKIGNIKDMSKGQFIKIAERGIDQTEDALQAETLVNNTMKKYGMGADWMRNFEPQKVQQVLDGLKEAMRGDLAGVIISPKTKRIVQQYTKWLSETQDRSYPLIKRAKEGYKDFSEFIGGIEKEVGTGAMKPSSVINRITNLGNNESIKDAIKYINSKTGVNLEDISTALMSEKLLGPGAKTMMGGGIVGGAVYAPAILAAAAGYTAFTSPALLYKLAKLTGGARNIAGKGAELISKMAKKIGVTQDELASALEKLRNTPNGENFLNTVKGFGKASMTPRGLSLIERIQNEIGQQFSQQGEQLSSDASNMEQAALGQMRQEQPMEPEQQEEEVGESIPENLYVDPNVGKAGYR